MPLKNVEILTPPFFGLHFTNLLVFFDFQPKKCFLGPNFIGFVWVELDERW